MKALIINDGKMSLTLGISKCYHREKAMELALI